jgi:hypothetical protein
MLHYQFYTLILCFLFFCSGAGAVDTKKVRLFILSGQSNMEGVNPDNSFTPAIVKAFPHDEVIVVKFALGGTPIRRWWKNWTGPYDVSASGSELPPGDLYAELIERVKKATEGKKPDSIVFSWMQGERDAKSGLSESYQQALKGVIACVREDLKQPSTAIVIGRLSDHQNGQKHWDAVRDIQVKIATVDNRGSWVDCDDLNGPKNDLHCTKEGFVELGKRFAAKAVELLSKGNHTSSEP